ncbi:MAG: hypothetical protein SFV51_05950 [Bryobacteraceae bacterium]|nr:hypothetical protein [Bryobacteraceae bacterium]
MPVDSLFQSALRRTKLPLENPGPAVVDEDGAMAVFSIRTSGDMICWVEYRCTTCATLVACCEALRLAVGGITTGAALQLAAADLAALVPGVPEARWSRLSIAVRALHAAVAA